MSGLLLISVQIICFCIAWALITFQLHPFADFWQFFYRSSGGNIPDWTMHSNYLIATFLAATGISATLKLRVIGNLLSISVVFLVILLAALSFEAPFYVLNIFQYSYILLIPYIFQKLFLRETTNIMTWISITLIVSMLFAPLDIATILNQQLGVSLHTALLSGILFLVLAFIASYGIYDKKYFSLTLQLGLVIFITEFMVNILSVLKGFSLTHFNNLSLGLLSLALVLFVLWVKSVSVVKD